MTAVSDQMRENVRRSLVVLRQSRDPRTSVPIENMHPHFASFSPDLTGPEMSFLLPLEVDGETVYVYLKRT